MLTQIQELYQPLFLYIRKRISHQEDAEDITQEIFYKLSKSDISAINNVKSWVYAIAKNTITDYYRKKKMYTEDIEDFQMEEDNYVEKSIDELSRCVSSYIEQLPLDYRLIMQLSELQEIPQKAIAEQLNMNYVTVRSKIQRGRKKLKDIFTECCVIHQGGRGSIMDFEQRQSCKNNSGSC